MKSESLSLVFSKIRTKTDAASLVDDINILLNSVFRIQTESIQEALQKNVGQSNQHLLSQVLLNEEITLLDKANIEKTLEALKNELTHMPDVTIFLSFPPTIGIIETVSKWLKTNISEKVLVRFLQDPELLGGAVIVHSGMYKDYSLRKKLQDVLSKNQNLYIKNL